MEDESAVNFLQFNRNIFGYEEFEGGTEWDGIINRTRQVSVDGQISGLETPGGIISELWPYLFSLAGLILFAMLLWGALEIQFGAADTKSAESGKKRITNAVIGFVLLFSVFWLGQIVQQIFGLNFGVGQPVPVTGEGPIQGPELPPSPPAQPGGPNLPEPPDDPSSPGRTLNYQFSGQVASACLVADPSTCWRLDLNALEQPLQIRFWADIQSQMGLPSTQPPLFSFGSVNFLETIGATARPRVEQAQASLQSAYDQLWALNTRIQQQEEQQQLQNAAQMQSLLGTTLQRLGQTTGALGQGSRLTVEQLSQARADSINTNSAIQSLVTSAQNQGNTVTAQEYLQGISQASQLVQSGSSDINFAMQVPFELFAGTTIEVRNPAGANEMENGVRQSAFTQLGNTTYDLNGVEGSIPLGSGETFQVQSAYTLGNGMVLTGRVVDTEMGQIFAPVQMEIEFEFIP